jgi:SpoVK/Ycf46/Vps4 family AAA+-type ATPase
VTHADERRARLADLLATRADRVVGGSLTEAEPFEFIMRGESLSARLYPRYNGTVVLAIDAYVDDVVEHPRVLHWVATRSGVMPFATLHIDRPFPGTEGPTVLHASHVLLADRADADTLDEVLDGLTFMARRARRRLAEVVETLTDDPEPPTGAAVTGASNASATRSTLDRGAVATATAPVAVDTIGAIATSDAATDDDDADDVGDDLDDDLESDDTDDADDTDDTDDTDDEELERFLNGLDASAADPFDALERSEVSSGYVRHAARGRDVPTVLAELDHLIGLGPVKREITSLVHSQQVAEMRRAEGLRTHTPSPHLVFLGNPGTGKTTVARLVGELYVALGLLPSGHVIETDRAGLVAGYVGQTAIKTTMVCEQAIGGVLFIDEAYSLASHSERDYGTEAIETLVTFMENHRNQFALVVAGYPDEMRSFLDNNPGLRSRFDITVPFVDYTAAELEQMITDLARQHDYEFSPDALQRVRATIAAWPRHRGFGNGREVRKLFSDITRRHASIVAAGRTGAPSADALRVVPADAVPVAPAATTGPRHLGYL